MKKKSFFGRIILAMLVFTLILSTTYLSAIASDGNQFDGIKRVEVKNINDNSVNIKTYSSNELITVNENNNFKLVKVYDKKTGITNYIKVDYNSKTIFSSYTNCSYPYKNDNMV